jgi:hypothetical protein
MNWTYVVYDSLGNFLRRFPTYKAAFEYLIMTGRYDWSIVKEE